MALSMAVALGRARSDEPVDPEVGDPYPLARCIIADTPFDEGENVQANVYEGREIRVCCDDCVNKFPDEAYFRNAAEEKE
jgi:hypothetical protein